MYNFIQMCAFGIRQTILISRIFQLKFHKNLVYICSTEPHNNFSFQLHTHTHKHPHTTLTQTNIFTFVYDLDSYLQKMDLHKKEHENFAYYLNF